MRRARRHRRRASAWVLAKPTVTTFSRFGVPSITSHHQWPGRNRNTFPRSGRGGRGKGKGTRCGVGAPHRLHMAAFRESQAAHERRESAVHDQAGDRIAVDEPQSGHQTDEADENGEELHSIGSWFVGRGQPARSAYSTDDAAGSKSWWGVSRCRDLRQIPHTFGFTT